MTNRRLVLVERDELIRAGIQMLIEEEDPSITLTTYTELEHLQQDLETTPFDILILDDNALTPEQIYAWLIYCQSYHPAIKIILISDRLAGVYVQKTLALGVIAYLYKQEIGDCLKLALQGSRTEQLKILSPSVIGTVRNMVNGRWGSLNEADLATLALLEEGMPPKQIAQVLAVNYQTICRRRRKLKTILDVTNNDQIIDAARRQDLI